MSDFWKNVGYGIQYASNPTLRSADQRMQAIRQIAPNISETDRSYMALGLTPPKGDNWELRAKQLSQLFPNIDPTTRAYMTIGMRPPSVGGGSGNILDAILAGFLMNQPGFGGSRQFTPNPANQNVPSPATQKATNKIDFGGIDPTSIGLKEVTVNGRGAYWDEATGQTYDAETGEPLGKGSPK